MDREFVILPLLISILDIFTQVEGPIVLGKFFTHQVLCTQAPEKLIVAGETISGLICGRDLEISCVLGANDFFSDLWSDLT